MTVILTMEQPYRINSLMTFYPLVFLVAKVREKVSDPCALVKTGWSDNTTAARSICLLCNDATAAALCEGHGLPGAASGP